MTFSRRLLSTTIAGAIALSLAACGSGEDTDAALSSEPIAPIAAPEGQAWVDTVTTNDRGGYVLGNPEAPIKLVEWGSLTCPGCAGFSAAASEEIRNKYVSTGRVSFELRSFAIHGPIDLALTRLIGCGSPEAAHPLADQIWANLGQVQQRAYANPQALEASLQLPENERFPAFAEAAGLYDFFSARGLSEDQARTCLSDWSEMERLAKLSQTYSQEDGVTRTPTFSLNGRMLEESSWNDIEAALQRAGAR